MKIIKGFTVKAISTIVLVLLIMATFSPGMSYTQAVADQTKKMLYFKNSNSDAQLMQYVEVTAGSTYYFVYSVASTDVDGIYVSAWKDDTSLLTKKSLPVSKTENNSYITVMYSITVPAEYSSESAYFGLFIPENAVGYVFDVSVYKSTDLNKKNILTNSDFNSGLDYWMWGWDVWFAVLDESGLNEWNNGDKKLSVMEYDEKPFASLSSNTGKNMLYFKNGSTSTGFMQRFNANPGSTYYLSYSIRTTDLDEIVVSSWKNEDRGAIVASAPLVSQETCDLYVKEIRSITIPKSLSNNTQELVFVGLNIPANAEGYIFDISLYDSQDTVKSELLPNSSFKKGLDYWAWGWHAWFGILNPANLREWSNEENHLKIVEYNDELLNTIKVNTSKYMLYFKNGTTSTGFMQRFYAEPGSTYYFDYSIRTTNPDETTVSAWMDGDRGVIIDKAPLVSKETHDLYIKETRSISIPKSYSNNDKELVFVGLNIPANAEGYVFDINVYNSEDDNKTGLLANASFKSGLNDWAWGWHAWFRILDPANLKEWSNEENQLKVVEYDESCLADIKLDISKKMLYFRNGPNYSNFIQRISVIPGETYYFTYSMFSTDYENTSVVALMDGDRVPLINETEVVSTKEYLTQKGKYITETHKIDIPKDFSEKDKELVFIGLYIPSYAEGYLFNISVCKSGDPEVLNLFANSTFKSGLDGWAWGWNAWFSVLDTSGLKEWSDGANRLKIVDFDSSKIDELIDLINADDGQWWQWDDIVEGSDKIATLKGKVTNQNAVPLTNVELKLISFDNVYIRKTNSKGEFSFENIKAEFCELFAINGNEQIETGYSVNLEDGDVVYVSLVCDTSVGKEQPGWEYDNVSDKVFTGLLKGTVYTPKLKTVANLPIHIQGIGETVTDKNGSFEFPSVPVGEYEIYTVLSDNSKYVFKTVTIKENVDLYVKLKYDADAKNTDSGKSDNTKSFWNVIIVMVGAVLIIAVGVVSVYIIKKKKSVK